MLEPALCAAPAARVVHVSSEVHSFAKASVEDLGGHRYYSAPIIGRWKVSFFELIVSFEIRNPNLLNVNFFFEKIKQFGAVSGMTILFAGMLDWR